MIHANIQKSQNLAKHSESCITEAFLASQNQIHSHNVSHFCTNTLGSSKPSIFDAIGIDTNDKNKSALQQREGELFQSDVIKILETIPEM